MATFCLYAALASLHAKVLILHDHPQKMSTQISHASPVPKVLAGRLEEREGKKCNEAAPLMMRKHLRSETSETSRLQHSQIEGPLQPSKASRYFAIAIFKQKSRTVDCSANRRIVGAYIE